MRDAIFIQNSKEGNISVAQPKTVHRTSNEQRRSVKPVQISNRPAEMSQESEFNVKVDKLVSHWYMQLKKKTKTRKQKNYKKNYL